MKKYTLIIALLFFSFFVSAQSMIQKKQNDKSYLKYEYDLADYLANVNGRGEVFINDLNTNDCFVEMYFYTSMYQVHYYITFTEYDFKGFSEKTTYNEPYNVENSTRECMEVFDGKKAEISKQSETSRKYISLALKLVEESLK